MSSADRLSTRWFLSFALLFSFLLLLRCERPVNPFGPDLFYVSTISGLNVRETAGIEGKLVDLLPFNTSVQILERSAEPTAVGGFHGFWVKIQYAGEEKEAPKQGWVFDRYLSDRPVERFFRVQSVEGLELREKPDLRAKVLGRIPFDTIGLIEAAGRRIDTIRGRRGFWFRASFEDVTGWSFSGQVLLAGRRYELEQTTELDVEDRELEEGEGSIKDILQSASVVEVHDFKDFRVHEARFHLRDHEICDRQESILVFERKRDGQLFVTSGFSARVEKENFPLNGALLMRSRSCSCCSASETLQAVFPDRAGPRFVDYHRENLEARCDGERSAAYRSQNRVDPESGDLFLFWQEPECGYDVEPLEDGDAASGKETNGKHPLEEKRPKKGIRVVQDFRHDVFARLRFVDGRLRLDRYQDRSIPKSLREAWERSDPL